VADKGKPENLKPFPKAWHHSSTRPVRIPEALESQVRSYARRLDSGERPEADALRQALAECPRHKRYGLSGEEVIKVSDLEPFLSRW